MAGLRSRTYKTEGIVLKRRNFGEADRIVTLYTKHYGKIRALAKGVRRVKSRKAPSLEPFNQIFLFLAQGKNLDLITETQMINSFPRWRKGLVKVGVAYYFCELVDKLTPDGQANQTVFNLLRDFLTKIADSPLRSLVRNFEEELLEELGFGVPEGAKDETGSLKSYIETITEKKINSPKILHRFSDSS